MLAIDVDVCICQETSLFIECQFGVGKRESRPMA